MVFEAQARPAPGHRPLRPAADGRDRRDCRRTMH